MDVKNFINIQWIYKDKYSWIKLLGSVEPESEGGAKLGGGRVSPEAPSPENYSVRIRPKFWFVLLYFIFFSLLNTTQKSSLVINGV